MAAVLEEAMGLAVWLNGYEDVTVTTVTMQFQQQLPLGLICTLGAWVSLVEDKTVHTRGLIASPTGQTFVEAKGIYLKSDHAAPPGEVSLARWDRHAGDAEGS